MLYNKSLLILSNIQPTKSWVVSNRICPKDPHGKEYEKPQRSFTPLDVYYLTGQGVNLILCVLKKQGLKLTTDEHSPRRIVGARMFTDK